MASSWVQFSNESQSEGTVSVLTQGPADCHNQHQAKAFMQTAEGVLTLHEGHVPGKLFLIGAYWLAGQG